MRKNLGVALSGGGIKAFSQVGVLRYLQEIDFRFDGFSGTSMGSIVAALMAHQIPIDQVEESLLRIEKIVKDENLLNPSNSQVFPLFAFAKSITGLIEPTRFVEIIKDELELYGIKHIKDIKLPLVITAVDLISGKLIYFTNQKAMITTPSSYFVIVDDVLMIDALRASCSFPMVFTTLDFNGMQLVDGGVLMNVPVAPLRDMKFRHILSISMDNINPFEASKKVNEIGARIFDLMANQSTNAMLSLSDLNLNVFDKKIGIFSFGQGKNAIRLGYHTAIENKKVILEFKYKLKKFFF